MIIEACRCQDGFGVNHNHLVYGHTGQPFPEVRIWVDWKKVAKALGALIDGFDGSKEPNYCSACGHGFDHFPWGGRSARIDGTNAR